MMQKLELWTVGLKSTKIEHAERVIDNENK